MAPTTDKEIASKVKSEFVRGNYANCMELLNKLSLKEDDLKLMHNKAVVEFYKSGTKHVQTFQRSLKDIFEKAELRPECLSTLDDVSNCVPYYNHAVLLYHHRQYRSALAILSKIFKYIESLDDSTAKRIGLLLIECYLCSHQPAAAIKAIKLIEAKFLSKPEDLKRKDGSPTGLYVRVQRCMCRALLQTHGTAALAPLLNSLPGPSVYRAFLQSYSQYLAGDCPAAIENLNKVRTMATGGATSGSNAPKVPSLADTGEHAETMYFNNMACVHHYMNKPNMAAFYLQQAIYENQKAATSAPAGDTNGGGGNKESAVTLHTIGSSRHHELLYNMGIALLHAGQPLTAFDCLIECLQVFTTNPRLWLRVAECCIMVYRHEHCGGDRDQLTSADLIEKRIGTGVHRKLVLRSAPSSHCSPDNTSAAIPNPTMEFASLALRNAWLILREDGEGESPVNVQPANPVTHDQVQSIRCVVLAASAFVHLCLHEPLLALKRAEQLLAQRQLSPAHQLLARMYAAEALLLLDHADAAQSHLTADPAPGVVVECADEQQQQQQCADGVLLQHADIASQSPVIQSWRPATLSGARLCLQYNLAVLYTRRHMLDRAWHLLKTMNPAMCEVPGQVVQLAVYIQLSQGNLDAVRSIMKQHVIRGL